MPDQPWALKAIEGVGAVATAIASWFHFRKASEVHTDDAVRTLAKDMQDLRMEFEVHSKSMLHRMLSAERDIVDGHREFKGALNEMQESWLDFAARMERTFKRLKADNDRLPVEKRPSHHTPEVDGKDDHI